LLDALLSGVSTCTDPSVIPPEGDQVAYRSGRLPLPVLCLSFLLLAAQADDDAAPGAGFRVIVNAANPITSLSRLEVSQLFLKQTRQWPSGDTVEPVDLLDRSPVREGFSQQIHDRDVEAVRAYWQRKIFQGRDVPPPVRETDQEVASFVIHRPAGIGYVSPDFPLNGQLKTLEISD
jgi:hypothetical protein